MILVVIKHLLVVVR